MRRARPSTRRSKVTVALAVMLMVGLMAPAANATGVIPKPFSMTVSPSTRAGTSKQFTLRSRTGGSRSSARPTSRFRPPGHHRGRHSRGTVSFVGQTVKLRNLNLAWLHSFTVKVPRRRHVHPSPSNIWGAAAKTGADFTGFAFFLLTPPSYRSVAITGSCSLAFVRLSQPTRVPAPRFVRRLRSRRTPLAGGRLRRGQQPQERRLPRHDRDGDRDQPGAGTLSGTWPCATSAGIATFAICRSMSPETATRWRLRRGSDRRCRSVQHRRTRQECDGG